MSTPKPRIRPKADPCRQRSEPPARDPPTYPDLDPPVFTQRDPAMAAGAVEKFVFQEDDCLR